MEKAAGKLAGPEYLMDILLYLLPGAVVLGGLWTLPAVQRALSSLYPPLAPGIATPSLGTAGGILVLLAVLGACYVLGQANRVIGSAWLLDRLLLRGLKACARHPSEYLGISSSKLAWMLCLMLHRVTRALTTGEQSEFTKGNWIGAVVEEGQPNPIIRAAEKCFHFRLGDEDDPMSPEVDAAVLELCEDVVRARLPALYETEIHRLALLDVFSAGMSTAVLFWLPFFRREFGYWWLAIPLFAAAFFWWSQVLRNGRENAIWRMFYASHCIQDVSNSARPAE